VKMATPATKRSLYFPGVMLKEIYAEATRRNRSISWVIQQAWRIARAEIRKMPSA
jgi:uncharacterized small protein (TIGR04563 family)